MPAITMTGTGIYSADGNSNTQAVRTLGGIGETATIFTTGSGSVSQRFGYFLGGNAYEISNESKYMEMQSIICLPGETLDYNIALGIPEIGNWNVYVIGAYYLSTNVLSAFQCQRLRLNLECLYNSTSGALTFSIRSITRNESFTSDATNFPTTKVTPVVIAGTNIAMRYVTRTSAAAGSRTVYRAFYENTYVS